jgi:hypothetical protein
MKNSTKRYEVPQAEVIEIETQGVLCASDGGGTLTSRGAGTTSMGMSEITDFYHP